MEDILRGRRVGNTTRQADKMVQDFFKNGFCKCIDHGCRYDSSGRITNTIANDILLRTVCNRLINEHRFELVTKFHEHLSSHGKYFKIKDRYTVELITPPSTPID